MTKISNKELREAVLTLKKIKVRSHIDETYGYSEEKYYPSQNGQGYYISLSPASNWTYCECCGNPINQSGFKCDCDPKCESNYGHISCSDLFSFLKKARNSGDEIIIS